MFKNHNKNNIVKKDDCKPTGFTVKHNTDDMKDLNIIKPVYFTGEDVSYSAPLEYTTNVVNTILDDGKRILGDLEPRALHLLDGTMCTNVNKQLIFYIKSDVYEILCRHIDDGVGSIDPTSADLLKNELFAPFSPYNDKSYSYFIERVLCVFNQCIESQFGVSGVNLPCNYDSKLEYDSAVYSHFNKVAAIIDNVALQISMYLHTEVCKSIRWVSDTLISLYNGTHPLSNNNKFLTDKTRTAIEKEAKVKFKSSEEYGKFVATTIESSMVTAAKNANNEIVNSIRNVLVRTYFSNTSLYNDLYMVKYADHNEEDEW